MAITNGYITTGDLQLAIDPGNDVSWSGIDDSVMETIIAATSRAIDNMTGRRFYSATETRYYTARWSDWLPVDDLLSVSTLKTDDNGDGTHNTTWAASDYILQPRNAAADSDNVRPYTSIEINENGDYSFPINVVDGVELVGTFGYRETPPPEIKQACLLMSHRLWKRKDAIFGVAGNIQQGVTVVQAHIRKDADVMLLLSSHVQEGPVMV